MVELQHAGSQYHNHSTSTLSTQGSLQHASSPRMHHSRSAVMSRGSTPSPSQTRLVVSLLSGSSSECYVVSVAAVTFVIYLFVIFFGSNKARSSSFAAYGKHYHSFFCLFLT